MKAINQARIAAVINELTNNATVFKPGVRQEAAALLGCKCNKLFHRHFNAGLQYVRLVKLSNHMD